MSLRITKTTDQSAQHAGPNLAAWSLLVGLLLFAVLAGPFFAGRIYTADDLGAFHLPVRSFYAERLADGEPYDWMPALFSGFYLTGEGQGGAYHPLHQLLYRFLPLRAALGWECLISYPWMMLGMWLLLKRRLGHSDAAMLGALLFTFSSFNLLHFIHPNAVAVIAHLPWLLWAIDIVLVDSRRRKVALATALIALLTGSQILLGYPQFVWFSLLAEISYAIFLLSVYKHAARTGCGSHAACDQCVGCVTRTWPRIFVALGIGLLIGGIQLLPSLDAWLNSSRMSVGEAYAFWGSLHPLNLLQILAPYMFTGRVVGDNTHEFSLYIGAVPLMLVAWLVVQRRELGLLAPLAWSSLGFGVAMLLLAFGQYGPLYYVLTKLPVIGGFRFPCRYLVLFQLAVAVLAAIGFVLLTRESRRVRRQRAEGTWYRERRAWWALWHKYEPLWCIVVLSVIVALVGVGLRRQPYIASVPAILAGPVLLSAAVALVVVATRGHAVALVGLVLLAACDQGWYGMTGSVYPKNAVLENFAASAHTPPGNPEGRVVASLLRVDEPGLRTGDLMTLSGWHRADGYAGLEPQRQLDYRFLPALRAAGVRWVQRAPSTSVIAGLKPCNDRWMEVPDPLPRVRLMTRARFTKDPAADITSICPDTMALCEVPLGLPASEPGTAAVISERPGRLNIEVDCPAPQLLVVAESYHHGWHATVDGKATGLYRTNGDFMGCMVGPGKHQVILQFQPASLQRGWLVSCFGLSLVSLCFLGFSTWPKPKRLEDLS